MVSPRIVVLNPHIGTREEMLRLANKYERLAAWTEELSPLLRQ
jgi:hypothetical protein